MPTGKHWLFFLYINIGFLIYILAIFYFNQIAVIKANWTTYRCNPLYMPLADNVEENFTYCVQNIQSNFTGFLLEPLSFATSSMSQMLGGFVNDLNMVRGMFDKIRTFIATIIETVFGVFLNLVIEFQRITIGIIDLMGKMIGIMTTLMYVMDGSLKTMNSTWNGPPGQLVKALGKCFHPNTLVVLKDGSKQKMKHIRIGDILENDTRVEAVLKIDNTFHSLPFYQINNVLVTGSHLIFDDVRKKWIKVEDHPQAINKHCATSWFSCLITDTHTIPINGCLFWDWEDHFVKTAIVI